MKKFSSCRLGTQILDFFSAPYKAPVRSFASIVFPWQNSRVLLCNIENRGWCVPGGRVEPDENSLEAAQREALEEGGALLTSIQYIGCYRMTETKHKQKQIRWADAYVSGIERLIALNPKYESSGRQFVTLEELPNVYYHWSDLSEEVFEYAQEVVKRFEAVPAEYFD